MYICFQISSPQQQSIHLISNQFSLFINPFIRISIIRFLCLIIHNPLRLYQQRIFHRNRFKYLDQIKHELCYLNPKLILNVTCIAQNKINNSIANRHPHSLSTEFTFLSVLCLKECGALHILYFQCIFNIKKTIVDFLY